MEPHAQLSWRLQRSLSGGTQRNPLATRRCPSRSSFRNAASGNRQRLPLDDAVTARGYRVSRLLMPREPEAVTACSTSRTRLPRHLGGSR